MSYNDFCGCDLEEWGEICKSYQAKRDETYKDRWERVRMLATITIQPHLKKRISPKGLLPFPWDNKEEDARPVPKNSRERFEKLVAKIGKTV